MIIPVPDEILPAEQLGRVHFVGIGGAALSGLARIMVQRGLTVTGSDAKDGPGLELLRRIGVVCFVGHQAESGRRRRHGRGVDRGSSRQPRGGARAGARAEVVAALGGGPVSDARSHVGRRHRHARQDHDDVDADHGAAGVRRRSVVRDRLDA